ncbi:hypothetical protein AVEN_273345-1 [Araneus ventricosus]|uniref:Uncharacterized protein n=1 Tax=Araneus ventricosus TaxID=182803 RepID=A0A4Y2MHK2_ARAVE|nr:hypothetical protein AVEN_273345-1 [Araneus ventricosus]
MGKPKWAILALQPLGFQNAKLNEIVTLKEKELEGYFGTDLVILNLGQVTRTSFELAPPSPNFLTTPAGGRLAHARFEVYQAHKDGASSVELGLKSGTIRFPSRYLTTRPLRQ